MLILHKGPCKLKKPAHSFLSGKCQKRKIMSTWNWLPFQFFGWVWCYQVLLDCVPLHPMVPLESRWTSAQSWFWWFPSSICTHLIWCMVMWTGAQNYCCQHSCSIETRELCVHIWMCACSTFACFFFGKWQWANKPWQIWINPTEVQELATYGLGENTRADTESGVFLFPLTFNCCGLYSSCLLFQLWFIFPKEFGNMKRSTNNP